MSFASRNSLIVPPHCFTYYLYFVIIMVPTALLLLTIYIRLSIIPPAYTCIYVRILYILCTIVIKSNVRKMFTKLNDVPTYSKIEISLLEKIGSISTRITCGVVCPAADMDASLNVPYTYCEGRIIVLISFKNHSSPEWYSM